MEHRLHKRIPVSVKAIVRWGDAPASAAVARNLSLEGAFLEIMDAHRPRKNGISLQFKEGHLDGLRLDALVIHYTGTGIGVIFKHRHRRVSEFYARESTRAAS